MADLPPCPRCDSTHELPHATDVVCFQVLEREMNAVIRQMRLLNRRKGKLLRERIRLRQRAITGKAQDRRASQKMLAGVLGQRKRPSPLALRRFSRSK